jgi:hypothetical protein
MEGSKASTGIVAIALGGAVLLASLALFVLAIMGGFGIFGAALAFVAFPICLLAPTPRHWWFLTAVAAVLAAAPAISFAYQILQPSPIEASGWTWSRNAGWTPIQPPDPFQTLRMAIVIWVVMFLIMLSALALLKRVGVKARDQL